MKLADSRGTFFLQIRRVGLSETLKFLADPRTWRGTTNAPVPGDKERNEECVKEPSGRLIAAAASKLGMDGKLMRVNRDIRFSKDKSPYKANIGISVYLRGVPMGPLVVGLYLHVAPKESFVATGVWQPEAPVLTKIRDAIVARSDAWATARKVGLDEDESALKRAPKGCDPEHKFIEDV